jgi:hypothetical protein
VYYLSLFARKKYCKDLIKSNDKTQLYRFTANKSNMLRKIKELERPLGMWHLREVSAPQESLVLYILPNPRCMAKANKTMGKHCWDLDRSKNYNLVTEAMSCIQKSKSRACFVDFDIDDKTLSGSDIIEAMKRIAPRVHPRVLRNTYTLFETRGGYHMLVDPTIMSEAIKIDNDSSLVNKYPLNWHGEITKRFPVDQSGDQMIPVPECVQGGFTPKMINYGTTL